MKISHRDKKMKMKTKILITILLLNILAVSCSAISRNASTEEQIEYIKKQSIKLQTKRMKSTWRNLCKKDIKTCTEKQQWFDDLLYDTETRKYDLQKIISNQLFYQGKSPQN